MNITLYCGDKQNLNYMNNYMLKLSFLAFVSFMFYPLISKSQQVVYSKGTAITETKDSIVISRYLSSIEYARSIPKISPIVKQPIRLNFQIPRVRVYNAATYYADGKFANFPFNSWGPYQVPFHLNQPIIVPLKEK
jgi:hypothetical protein